MEIMSVNSTATVGPDHVAFNVAGRIDPQALDKVHYGTLKLAFSNGLLVMSAQGKSGPRIDAALVKAVASLYAAAELAVDKERTAAKKAKARMLNGVSAATGLHVAG